MRQVAHRLYDPLVADVAALVEHQPEEDAHGKGKDQHQRVDAKRIDQHLRKLGRSEQLFKPLPAHPLAAPDALQDLVVAEGDLHAVDGVEFEIRKHSQGGQDEQIQLPVFFDTRSHLCPPYGQSVAGITFHGRTSLANLEHDLPDIFTVL
ncbi:hypothetical protein SDC9_159571 [bioreactor metagenome]|uniref:Uncharacterized protein n=1 Tax=bioreactor metagenome TaxID=1076179 RepID=A0A645FD71_9ZZZZ